MSNLRDGRPKDSLSTSDPSRTAPPASHSLRYSRHRQPKRAADALRGLLAAIIGRGDRLLQKAEQEIGSLRCRARRPHDGAVVLAQHLEPGADIVGVAH